MPAAPSIAVLARPHPLRHQPGSAPPVPALRTVSPVPRASPSLPIAERSPPWQAVASPCRSPPRIANFLERRGGRSHRGNGAFSRSVVLSRMLDSLRLYQEFTDPRDTRGMPEEFHALVVSLLPEPWALRRYEIRHLEGVLEATPGFAAAVTAAGVDPAALLAAVAATSPAEKLTLVDHAIQHQVPAAAATGRADGRDGRAGGSTSDAPG